MLTDTGDETWQVSGHDGSTGEPATPRPTDLAGATGRVPREGPRGPDHHPVVATADGAFVVLSSFHRHNDVVVVIDVAAGTAQTVPSENALTFTAVDGTTVYLTSRGRHTATYDLAGGEAVAHPDRTKVPYLVTDRGALFEDVLNEDQNILVTR